jgi:hypothetical protein
MAAFDGPTCDYNTTRCYHVPYGVTVSRTDDVTRATSTVPWDDVVVNNTTATWPSAEIDLDLPAFEPPKRPVALRTSVREVVSAMLSPKTVDRVTQVAWTRGRAPRGCSFRTLRCWGTDRRR